MVDWHRFRQEQFLRLADVFRRADTGDTVRGIKQRVGDLAGDHVGFVGVGDGDQHVGVFCAGFAQHPRVGTMPLNHPQIEFILQLTQAAGIGIDDGDIVVFTHQVFRQRPANLTGTKNNYFHRVLCFTLKDLGRARTP